MTPYTVQINETERKVFDELLSNTKADPRPIIVTRDDSGVNEGETVAIVFPPDFFEDSPQAQPDLYEFQLLRLVQELDKVERYWDDKSVQQAFIEHFSKRTFTLWKSCPDNMKRVCMSLDLAAKHLVIELLTREQIGALRYYIDLICQDVVDGDEIRKAKKRLTSSGLPPTLSGSQELVDVYIEDL